MIIVTQDPISASSVPIIPSLSLERASAMLVDSIIFNYKMSMVSVLRVTKAAYSARMQLPAPNVCLGTDLEVQCVTSASLTSI